MKDYPDSVCQACGGLCERTEEVWTGCIPGGWELWCYCPSCDIQTFHSLPAGYDPTSPKSSHPSSAGRMMPPVG